MRHGGFLFSNSGGCGHICPSSLLYFTSSSNALKEARENFGSLLANCENGIDSSSSLHTKNVSKQDGVGIL
jgi:hypothetical protein